MWGRGGVSIPKTTEPRMKGLPLQISHLKLAAVCFFLCLEIEFFARLLFRNKFAFCRIHGRLWRWNHNLPVSIPFHFYNQCVRFKMSGHRFRPSYRRRESLPEVKPKISFQIHTSATTMPFQYSSQP